MYTRNKSNASGVGQQFLNIKSVYCYMQRALIITRFQQSEYADPHTVRLTVQIPCT
jgi:hypothetical protein